MVVHHITPAENLWTLITLYVAFTFFVSTTPSFHFVSKNFLETVLGEALNDNEVYLKSDRGTQLVNPGSMIRPRRFTPGKDTCWPLYRMLFGPRVCSGRYGKSDRYRCPNPEPSSPYRVAVPTTLSRPAAFENGDFYEDLSRKSRGQKYRAVCTKA